MLASAKLTIGLCCCLAAVPSPADTSGPAGASGSSNGAPSRHPIVCPEPYLPFGSQCLFFSQPYDRWDLGWHNAYLDFYSAVEFCRLKAGNLGSSWGGPGGGGGSGYTDLAAEIRDSESVRRYCNHSKYGCGATWLYRGDGRCLQWSTMGSSPLPCDTDTSLRFACEFRPQ